MSTPSPLKPAAKAALAFCTASVLLLALPAQAAMDMFVKIATLRGESADPVFGPAGASDVLAWSWGMSNSGGAPNFQDLSLTKYLDTSTPGEMLGVANGTVFSRAQLSVRRAGEADVFFTVVFDDVRISSLSLGGSGGEDRFTTNISLMPLSRITMSYTPEIGVRRTAVWTLDDGAFQSFRGNAKALEGLFAAGAGASVVPGNPITQPVPEPQTWALFGLGLAGLAWARRRQRRATFCALSA